jgi:transposase
VTWQNALEEGSMRNRSKDSMDVREILRQIRAGESDRAIGRNLKINRATVKKYREWAQGEGVLEGELPPIEELQTRLLAQRSEQRPPQNVSSVEDYRDQVVQWRAGGVRMKAIYARLQEQGFEGSYSAVRRFVRQLEPLSIDVTVRVERAPGEEAQVDFGYAGYMRDDAGQRRKSWAFVMTLAWSRHQYVEFVFDQRVDTWIEVHRHAFEFFGGVPKKVVPDNLKAAIARASWDGTDPQVQWAYRECAEHYGFLIAPCRPFTPQHKGKVERGVDYVKNNFLAGRGELPLAQANRVVREWCLTTAGQRIHGTTKQPPLACFEQTERMALRPLVMIGSKLPRMIGTKIPTLDKVAPWKEDGLVNSSRFRGAAARVRSGEPIHDQRDVSQRNID